MSYFFSAEKLLTPLTHSFWRLAVFFFSRSGKKKYRPEIQKNQKIWTKFQKIMFSYNWFLVSKNYKFTPCYPIFRQKWWSRIYLAYFFFPRKLGAGKKIPQIITHSPLFWDFLAKHNFSRKKNTTPLLAGCYKFWKLSPTYVLCFHKKIFSCPR